MSKDRLFNQARDQHNGSSGTAATLPPAAPTVQAPPPPPRQTKSQMNAEMKRIMHDEVERIFNEAEDRSYHGKVAVEGIFENGDAVLVRKTLDATFKRAR